MNPFSAKTRSLIHAALSEDLGSGDITTRTLVPMSAIGKAEVTAREDGIFCGKSVAQELFRHMNSRLRVKFFVKDGTAVSAGKVVFEVRGPMAAILSVERTVLNFISHLSGVATHTQEFVRKLKKYSVAVLDTRKTTPLWRELEKYAVRIGGGRNHRMGLYDQIFVKENHRPFGHVAELVRHKRQFVIEVHNLEELRESLSLKPKIILFDNFSPAILRKAVRMARAEDPEVILEASGGITLKNCLRFAAAGVDQVSVGSLTHSVKNIDFSLEVV